MNAGRDLPRLVAVIAVGVLAALPLARLPAFYDSFLYLESPSNHNHVGGLAILDPSTGPDG